MKNNAQWCGKQYPKGQIRILATDFEIPEFVEAIDCMKKIKCPLVW